MREKTLKLETAENVERERERATLYSTWNSSTQPSSSIKYTKGVESLCSSYQKIGYIEM